MLAALFCKLCFDLWSRNVDDLPFFALHVVAIVLADKLIVPVFDLLQDTAILCLDEAVFIDAAIRRQRADQTDVRTFRGLDRTDTPIVAMANVSNLEARAVA